MIQKKLKIINKLGLHARAAIKLTNLVSRYQSEIFISFNDRKVNAKSLMCLMVIAVTQNAEIELIISGNDEKEAIEAIEKLINDKFGEED